MTWQRIAVGIAVLIVALVAWLGRYDIIAVSPGIAYRLGRWTGNVFYIIGQTAYKVETEEK